jgi:uncharacterized repeat protein (TIGR01451 family)
MRLLTVLALLAVSLLHFVGTKPATAATFTVTNAADSGAGSLRQAMLDAGAAAGADTIVFDPAFFATPRTITLLSNLPVIVSPLTITGPGVNNLTISALGCAVCNVLVVNGSLTVSGLTLSGASNGGLVSLGTTTADGVVITGNTVGGGVQVLGGVTTIRNTTISNNSSTGNGGGIRLQTGSLSVSFSTLSGNTAASDGGGLWANAPWNLSTSTVSGNTASRGGGIFVTAAGFPAIGGGIISATLFENLATAGGGGSAIQISGAQVGSVTVTNSILVQGTSGSTPVCVAASNSTSLGNNIFGDASCGIFGAGSDRHNLNLPLGALALNGGPTRTHLPPAGSPAIDTGGGFGCGVTDQRGLPRPADGDGNGTSVCDVGAVEVQAVGPAPLPPDATKSFTPATIVAGGTSTLAVNLTNNGPSPLTGIGFTDTMPAGMTVVSAATIVNTCGGTVTAFTGSSQMSLSAGSLALGASCTVSVDVTTNGPGAFVNQTGPISSSAGAGASASATLTVNPAAAILPPAIEKVFAPGTVAVGDLSRLTISFTNNNAAQQLTNVSVTDVLPAGVTVALSPNVTHTCGGSTVVNAPLGGTTITVTGGVLAPTAVCIVSVNVRTTAAGTALNTTGPVSAQESGAGGVATAALIVTGGTTGGGSSSPAPQATPTPTVTPPPPPPVFGIPQGVQNQGVIAALMGGIGNGTRNATPVPSRPAAVAPPSAATGPVVAMPSLRPPSTGDAGLICDHFAAEKAEAVH